jgi:endonuclease/exonuclease/phosphatase family metal-dependent hydrolase
MCVERILTTLALTTLVVLSGCSDSSDNQNSPPEASASPSVTLANLNILHGFNCDPPTPADGDQCRVRERVALLREHLVAQGCPDLVTLQEIVNQEYLLRSPTEPLVGPLDSIVDLIEAELPELETRCGFTYELVYQPFLDTFTAETDEELIMSRYPVLQANTYIMHSALYDGDRYKLFARHLLYVRIDHPTGEVDVYTTHLSSGSDAATNSCNSFYEIPGFSFGPSVPCPMECSIEDTVRACQAEQLALYVERTRGADNLALISGDFNAEPGSSEYLSMTSRGWLDSHVVAGQSECNSASGIGCTSGRNSSAESLENPAFQVDRRIDYIFTVLPQAEDTCIATTDGDHLGTYEITTAGLFAAEPNPFSEGCGSVPNPMCWVSDHSGNQVQLNCRP